MCAWSSTSAGRIIGWMSSGVSMRPPIWLGMYSTEKFRSMSRRSRSESPSPSQSLLFAACQQGFAKHTWALVNPTILPTTPTEVCGARPTAIFPRRSVTVLML